MAPTRHLARALRRRAISRAAMIDMSLEFEYCHTSESLANSPLQAGAVQRQGGAACGWCRGSDEHTAGSCARRVRSTHFAIQRKERQDRKAGAQTGTEAHPRSSQFSTPSCSKAEACHTMREGVAAAGGAEA